MQEIITKRFKESVESKQALLNNTELTILMSEMAQRMIAALRNGNKIMFCGNGGSAVDAMHLAAELSGRYYFDRKPLNAEALSADNAFLTAVANDYGYDVVYARLIDGIGNAGKCTAELDGGTRRAAGVEINCARAGCGVVRFARGPPWRHTRHPTRC